MNKVLPRKKVWECVREICEKNKKKGEDKMGEKKWNF